MRTEVISSPKRSMRFRSRDMWTRSAFVVPPFGQTAAITRPTMNGQTANSAPLVRLPCNPYPALGDGLAAP